MTWASYSQPQVPDRPIRATDRDRDAAIDTIQASYTVGRLSMEEYDARLGHALTAQTYAQLDELTADLPGRPTYPDAPAIPQPRHTNGLAIASLVCGIAQPFTLMLSTIPAIALGHAARRQIRRNGDDGQPMATAGLVLGWAGLSAVIMFVLAIVALGVLISGAVHGHGS